MSEALRLGLIGCGEVTRDRHLPALQSFEGARVVALCDPDPARLAEAAGRVGNPRRYTHASALLEDADVEAVAICVPADSHVELAIAALEAGKHALVEKPLALSLDESARLVERATNCPHKLLMGFNLRWHRLVRRARTAVRDGAAGELELIRTVFTSRLEAAIDWRSDPARGGGSLHELAVHLFDVWRFVSDCEIDEVFAFTRDGRWPAESATICARLSNGALATAVVSQGTADANQVEVFGNRGRVHACCFRFDGFETSALHQPPGAPMGRLIGLATFTRELPGGMARLRTGGEFLSSYRAEWEHFVDVARRGKEPECSAQDGHRALEATLAAIASAASHRPVIVARAPRTTTAALAAGAPGDTV